MEITISQVEAEADIAAVRSLLREYIAWAFTLTSEAPKAPTFQGIDEELATLPGIYAPPAGRLLVAKHDGQVGGCICLKPLDTTTSEVKRLYVSPNARGLNLGALLVDKLIEEARDSGYKRIVLDSHISMERAHAVYEAAGFHRVEAPADFPAEWKRIVVFMECSLSPSENGKDWGEDLG